MIKSLNFSFSAMSVKYVKCLFSWLTDEKYWYSHFLRRASIFLYTWPTDKLCILTFFLTLSICPNMSVSVCIAYFMQICSPEWLTTYIQAQAFKGLLAHTTDVIAIVHLAWCANHHYEQHLHPFINKCSASMWFDRPNCEVKKCMN